jgi:chloramphenicol-sensitive protein RarD
MPSPSSTDQTGGFAYALGAFGIWGLLPFYILLVQRVSAFELVGWRAIFTFPICVAFIAARRQGREFWLALANWKNALLLLLTATLIGSNWLLYIWSVMNNHVYAASLGYYINPLLNVLIGTVFLDERLSFRQWIAVGLAGIGVGILATGALTTLWISLALACSFATYGLVRKLIPVGALPGLAVESLYLVPPGIILIWFATHDTGHLALEAGLGFSLLIASSGILTAVPLYCFSEAARRMDYSTLGFLQFIVPTIVFISGLTVFHEPLQPVQLASFIFIWAAIGVFCWDLSQRHRVTMQRRSKAPREA